MSAQLVIPESLPCRQNSDPNTSVSNLFDVERCFRREPPRGLEPKLVMPVQHPAAAWSLPRIIAVEWAQARINDGPQESWRLRAKLRGMEGRPAGGWALLVEIALASARERPCYAKYIHLALLSQLLQ
jgi:hypothetical protein